MDSGANIFIFPPAYAISETIAPSLHCLTSATSGPAHVPLHSAEVMFGMRDSTGTMRRFRQHAFIHADLPFALFPLSSLGARGCYFDFYNVIGLQCGPMFLPFSLIDGLYLAKIFTISLSSADFSTFDDFTSDLTVLVAQTRSHNLVLPEVVVIPASIDLSASLVPAAPPVSPVFTLPEPSVSFSSKLTGAGLLLLHAHRRLGHLHDRLLKRMIDCGMCGALVWVPGIVIRAHCWDCLKGQQKRNVPSPDPNLRDLHPLLCQLLVWDWCGPHHVCALHSELY